MSSNLNPNHHQQPTDLSQYEYDSYKSIHDEMMFAAYSGDLETLTSILAIQGIDVNYKNTEGDTALTFATCSGHLEIAKFLLQIENINVNVTNKKGFFPLLIAAFKGNVQIVEQLLRHPFIDVNQNMKGGKNPTALMAVVGYSALINSCGYEFFADDSTEETTLNDLLQQHEIEIWGEKLLSTKNERQRELVRPKISVYSQIVSMLLMHEELQIEKQNLEGQSALIWACEYGHAIFVEQLLQKGANKNVVSAKNSINSRTIFSRVIASKIEVAQKINLLLQHPESLPEHVLDDALSLASGKANTEIFIKLIESQKVDVNSFNVSGGTPLTIAAEQGHLEIVQILLNNPTIQVNQTDRCGFPPLYYAACNGRLEIVHELLNHPKIDVNQRFGKGNKTVLMRICGYTALVRSKSCWKLFAQGQGISDMAEFDSQDIRSMLVQNEKEIKQRIETVGESGKMNAARTKISIYSFIMEAILLHTNTNIDLQDGDGKTALMHACAAGHATFVKQLISKQANINIQSQACETALHNAVRSKLERSEKLDILLMQTELQVNLQGLRQIFLNDQQFKICGNALVFAILEGFSDDNITIVKDLLFSASKSDHQFAVNIKWGIDALNELSECKSILQLAIKFEKYALTSQIFQGLISNKINPQQLPYFLKVVPMISEHKKFYPILAQYVNSEATIMQRLSNGFPQFEITLQEKKARFLSELVEHARDYSVFQSQIVEATVSQLWQGFAKWYLRFQSVLFFIFMILIFSVVVVHIKHIDQQNYNADLHDDYYPTKSQKILWASFSLAIIMLLTEFLQVDFNYIRLKHFDVINSFKQIMVLSTCVQGISNILDWFIIMGGLLLPLFWPQQTGTIDAFFAFYIIILFFRGLLWLLLNRNLGHLILIMGLIIWKTSLFVVLMILFLLVFSLSFKVLNIDFSNNEDSSVEENPPTFFKQIFRVMLGLFGEVNLDVFFEAESPKKEMGFILLVFFIILIPLLIINLLISLMTSTYEDMSKQRDSIFVRNQAVIILEVNRVIKNLKHLFPFMKSINNQQNDNIVVVKQGLDCGLVQYNNGDMMLLDTMKRVEQTLQIVSRKQQVIETNVAKRLQKLKLNSENLESKLDKTNQKIEFLSNIIYKQDNTNVEH